MRAKEFIVELHLQPDVDEGWKDWAAGAAMAAAALGPGASTATVPQQNYQNDPINAIVKKKEAEQLNALERLKIENEICAALKKI